MKNLQLIGDVKDEFEVEPLVNSAMKQNLDSTMVVQHIKDVKNSSQVHNNSRDIIVKLVKRQRSMEQHFVNKMERDFKAKCDEINTSIVSMMTTVDARLEKMRVSSNAQMDEGIIDEENNLWKDVETLKL